MYSISEQPKIYEWIYKWSSAFIHTRLQTGQITKWPANATVSEILESTGLISCQAKLVPFQGIKNEKDFENKLCTLKECMERHLK